MLKFLKRILASLEKLHWELPGKREEVPETALRTYPFAWRVTDRKLFILGSDGLYRAEDGEKLRLYLIQLLRKGENQDYILADQGTVFPVGSQYFPHDPLPEQSRLLQELERSEKASRI